MHSYLFVFLANGKILTREEYIEASARGWWINLETLPADIDGLVKDVYEKSKEYFFEKFD
jgi:hypothetical protein